jgi:hypothetical protein
MGVHVEFHCTKGCTKRSQIVPTRPNSTIGKACIPLKTLGTKIESHLDLLALQKKLGLWLTDLKLPERQQHVQDLLQQELPRFEKELRGWQQETDKRSLRPTPPPSRNPSDNDTANFAAFQSWFARVAGGKPFPEAELRLFWRTVQLQPLCKRSSVIPMRESRWEYTAMLSEMRSATRFRIAQQNW